MFVIKIVGKQNLCVFKNFDIISLVILRLPAELEWLTNKNKTTCHLEIEINF